MSDSMKYVLVTGTNGGIGLGICSRLIDDFFRVHPAPTSLTIVFTTRSTRKGIETLQCLKAHLQKNHSSTSRRSRIHFQPENVELTSLLSIRALVRKLLASDIPHLNAMILNAGIGGWVGMDWPKVFRDVALDPIHNTTWPQFKLGVAGWITEKQFPQQETSDNKGSLIEEPPLAQIFTANVFGHYILVHELMPLLRACPPSMSEEETGIETGSDAGRIIWTSSIEPQAKDFEEADLTALHTRQGYESSKRLVDILSLTYDTHAAKESVNSFISTDSVQPVNTQDSPARQVRSKPTMHVTHPGVCVTNIVPLFWIMHLSNVLGILISRWVGSPWAVVSPYLAGMSFTWLALAPEEQIAAGEKAVGRQKEGVESGRVKWGTSVTRLGQESISPTEVEGWGLNGCGEVYGGTWWGGRYGRAPGAKDATKERIEEFKALGGRVWSVMEQMRREWEERINEYEKRKRL